MTQNKHPEPTPYWLNKMIEKIGDNDKELKALHTVLLDQDDHKHWTYPSDIAAAVLYDEGFKISARSIRELRRLANWRASTEKSAS